jgi:peptidoglycan hydrolase CwlO-like protein
MESNLKRQHEQIERLNTELDSLLYSENVAAISAENKKLNYQIKQLQNAIAEEKANLTPLTGKIF